MPAPKEPHPESLTPRVFVTIWTDVPVSWGEGTKNVLKVYELLKSGEAVEWDSPPDPEVVGRFWALSMATTLSDVNFVRPQSDLSHTVVPQEVLDQLEASGLKVGENGNIEFIEPKDEPGLSV